MAHLNLIMAKTQYVDRPQFYGEHQPGGAPIPYYSDEEDY